jgi:DNA invertase Pin-like site-specific DNA recombinase
VERLRQFRGPNSPALFTQICDGETLVVSKLNRLGRDAVDVLQAVRNLADLNIQAIVLQLG